MKSVSSISRIWTRRLHMFAGLTLLLYSFAIGISGSILVFDDFFTQSAWPQFHAGGPVAIETTPDQALAAVQAAFPRGRILSITFPNAESPHWMSYVLLGPEAREVFVHASTGKLIGSRNPSGGWLGWVKRLHTSLQGGSLGRKVNGYGAWLVVAMCITGIILWWPAAGQWASRFRLHTHAGWRVLSWELHHIVGIVSLPFLLILGITGTYYIWSSNYVKAVGSVFGRTAEPKPGAVTGPLMTIDMLSAKARAAMPGLPIHRIQVVDRTDQAVRVTMREGTEAEFHLVSTVFLHPVTGDVLFTNALATRPAGDAILSWFSALHFGIFGGLPVRVLWALMGLTFPALGVTGFLLWWRRVVEPSRRKEKRKEYVASVAK